MAAPAIFVLCALLATGAAHAQAVQRTFQNLGFEQPVPTGATTSACWYFANDDGQVPGWTTSHSSGTYTTQPGSCSFTFSPTVGRPIELWRSVFNGVTAREGSQFAELNASEASRLSQNVCVVNGEQINWQFSHQGRNGNDVMEFLIGPTPIVRVQTNNTGTGSIVTTSLGSASRAAGPNNWSDYTGNFIWNGDSGVRNIGFSAISAAGGVSQGNLLDRIQIFPTPYLEFNTNSAQGSESVAAPPSPGLSVTGTVTSSFAVTVNITGGTATRGPLGDYTTPGGAATFTVTIPAGTYNGTTSIPLGISIINDALIEAAETIIFQIQPSPANFLLSSTQSCGSPAIASSTYTILDNDSASLSLTKSGTLVDLDGNGPDVGDRINYSFVVTNTGTVALTNVTVADTLPGITITGSPINLAVGASNSTSFTATYIVTQANVDAGQVVNSATASGRDNLNNLITSPPSTRTVGIERTPNFTVAKTVNAANITAPSALNYTITVQNTGNTTLTGVAPVDTLPDGSTASLTGPAGDAGTVGSLDVGETWTYTTSFAVNQARFDTGANLVNNISVTSSQTQTARTASATTTITRNGALVLTKTPGAITDTDSPANGTPDVGDTVAYTFSVQNTGTVTLNNVTIADPRLPSLSCTPIASLAVGATAAFTCASGNLYALTAGDITAGTLSNTATATGTLPNSGPTVSDPDTRTITIPTKQVALRLRKQWTTAAINDTAIITVTRAGSTIATFGATANTATELDIDPAIYTVNPGNVLTLSETLGSGNTGAYTATLSCTGAVDTNAADGLTVNAEDGAIICTFANVRGTASLVTTKTRTTPSPALTGSTVSFLISVRNDGPATATNVRLTDLLPTALTYQSHTPGGASYNPATGLWTIGTLANGATATLTINATIN